MVGGERNRHGCVGQRRPLLGGSGREDVVRLPSGKRFHERPCHGGELQRGRGPADGRHHHDDGLAGDGVERGHPLSPLPPPRPDGFHGVLGHAGAGPFRGLAGRGGLGSQERRSHVPACEALAECLSDAPANPMVARPVVAATHAAVPPRRGDQAPRRVRGPVGCEHAHRRRPLQPTVVACDGHRPVGDAG